MVIHISVYFCITSYIFGMIFEAVLLQEKAKEMHDFTVKAATDMARADYAEIMNKRRKIY